MAGGICTRCSRKALKGHLLCDKCSKMCCKCHKRPRASGSSYCLACQSAYVLMRRKRTHRECRVCGSHELESRRMLCETCRNLCTKCHKEPRPSKNRSICTHCDLERQREAIKLAIASDPDYVQRRRLRTKVNNAIRRGETKREPCVVCGNGPGMVYVKRVRGQLISFFVCRKHYDEYSGRNGTKPW